MNVRRKKWEVMPRTGVNLQGSYVIPAREGSSDWSVLMLQIETALERGGAR